MKKNYYYTLLFFILSSCSKHEDQSIKLKNEIDLLSKFNEAEVLSATTEHVTQDFKSITIDQNTRWSMFSHPNSQIHFVTDISISDPFTLSFYIGIDELAWKNENGSNTDGVEFLIHDQNNLTLFQKYLNPALNEIDRGWVKEEIKVERIKNNPVTKLIFETKSGLTHDSDWAYWADPKIILTDQSELHKSHDKINVILFTIDTLRKDYLNCYGNSWIQTSNMNYLAENGVLFENAYSSSSTTSPSHASIFTSLNPYIHGVIGNDYHLGNKIPTLTQIFSESGYKTGAAVSAYHLNPNHCGLDHYFDFYVHPKETTESYRWKLINSGYSTVSSGLEFLDQNHNNPFFLWLHLYDAHMPYIPVAEYDRMYYQGNPFQANFNTMKNAFYDRNFNINNEPWMHGVRDLEYFKRQYGAEITYVDDQIGRIIEALKRLKLDESTLVVLTADHGESLSEHDIYFNHWGLYNVEISVPLIVYYPKKIPKKKRFDDRVSIIDIAPTIVDLIGESNNYTAKTMFDGLSLVPIWKNNQSLNRKSIHSNSLFYIQTASIGERYKVNWIIRDATYNDEHLSVTKDQVEVFDLINDPWEENPPAARFLWHSTSSENLVFTAGDTFHDRLMKIRNAAKLKTVPSYEEWNKLFTVENEQYGIEDSLKNNKEFFNEIQYLMQQMVDELNVDLQNKLGKIVDLAGLKEIDKKSMNINDENYKEQMASLGYTGSN